MKFILENKEGYSLQQFFRKLGYKYAKTDVLKKDHSFVRELDVSGWPRLHVYAKETDGTVECNIHLDQKRASYKGNHMHSGEYENDIIRNEILRMQNIIE